MDRFGQSMVGTASAGAPRHQPVAFRCKIMQFMFTVHFDVGPICKEPTLILILGKVTPRSHDAKKGLHRLIEIGRESIERERHGERVTNHRLRLQSSKTSNLTTTDRGGRSRNLR